MTHEENKDFFLRNDGTKKKEISWLEKLFFPLIFHKIVVGKIEIIILIEYNV